MVWFLMGTATKQEMSSTDQPKTKKDAVDAAQPSSGGAWTPQKWEVIIIILTVAPYVSLPFGLQLLPSCELHLVFAARS